MSCHLLDSNAYFRLAKSFHPLLGGPFGPQKLVLQVLAEVDREYSRNPKLDSKFSWVSQAQYAHNRKSNLLVATGDEAENIKHAGWFIRDWRRDSRKLFQENRATPPSPVDCAVLAHGYVLGATVVTDDGGMVIAAREFNIKPIGSHELLKLLLDAKTVTLEQVRAAVAYLDYEKDLPVAWRRNAKRLFGITLP